ncbi:BCCT family transporter [Streptomyces sulphureus]|uniref:BCCT family transporter n=1 Tax=Streptomyces sulphureus TaxID=47758 RepID=UPI00036B9828|nr:BCCT family transporter [Streptomyces sulphureus]
MASRCLAEGRLEEDVGSVGSGIVTVLCVIAIVVIMLFFITSADSCALVVDVLSHGGRSETPRRTRVFWAVLVGVSGGVLLLAGGESALTVLQVSSLAGAAPLSVVYALAMVALWKVFRYEVAVMPRYVRITTQKAGDQASRGSGSATGSGGASSLRELVRSHEADADRTDRRLGAAVSLAGLAPGAGTESSSSSSAAGETSVLAVHDLDPETVVVDPEAGAITVDGDAEVQDPIGGEVFDTPEFSSSAAGAAHEYDKGDQPQ